MTRWDDHITRDTSDNRSAICVENDRNSEIIYNDPKTTATPDRGQLLHKDEAL